MIDDLKHVYPNVPTDPPAGCGGEFSTYLHFIVCYLEYVGLARCLEQDAARSVFEFWASDHYTAVYSSILRDRDTLDDLIARHGLLIE